MYLIKIEISLSGQLICIELFPKVEGCGVVEGGGVQGPPGLVRVRHGHQAPRREVNLLVHYFGGFTETIFTRNQLCHSVK